MDWGRLRAVVVQSDDWGLCAWVPDDRAHRVLADQAAFRSPAGRIYGRSTLEHAADVQALARVLAEAPGRDGLPAVLQANTIVANPDPARLHPPEPGGEGVPVLAHPALPPRWQRPGLWDAVRAAESAGVWWAELHGLHHLPATAWLRALRRGEEEARRAFDQGSPLCAVVEAAGEYGPGEPRSLRAADLAEAVAHFTRLFGRPPASFCPPDYRFDDWLEHEAARRGIAVLQGKGEQHGARGGRLRRWWLAQRFPLRSRGLLVLPPRIAFEPRGNPRPQGPVGLDAAWRKVRREWDAGRPACLSTHRANYAHLDGEWSAAGRDALARLLARLGGEGATFLVDDEVRQLLERGWSLRPWGADRVLLRHHGVAREPLRFPAPAGVTGARCLPPSGGGDAGVKVHAGTAEARVERGEHLIAWERA